MQPQPQQIDTLYQIYGKNLYRITGEEGYDSIMDVLNADTSNANSTGSVTTAADSVDSGVSTSTTNQASGAATQQGKTTFDNTVPGYILGFDPSDGYAKFYIGNSTSYLNWTGTELDIAGTITASSINIPDTTTTASFHVDASGNTWWGANVSAGISAANASITSAGIATFKSVVLSGSVAISGIANSALTDVSLLEFTQSMVFTSASAVQVNWSSGTIVLSNGRTFSISSGNTGTMSGVTYIYLDTGASVTVLQTTTTYSTAIGANKILIATAQNNTNTASVIPFGGGQPVLDGTANISAASITAASIAATTITAAKMNVSDLSTISANIGSITAGSISVVNGGNTVGVTPGNTLTIFSGPTGSPNFFVDANGFANAIGLSSINKKAYTNFEGSGRFNNTSTAGTTIAPSYGNQGVTIDTTATADRYCRILWYVANVYTNNPTFTATLLVNAAPAGTGECFVGLGEPTVAGTGHSWTSGNTYIGFELVNVLGSSKLSVRGVVFDGTTEAETSYASDTVTTGDSLEVFLKVTGTSVAFYYRKNGGSLVALGTIASNVPTSSGENSVQFSVSNANVANQTQIILQCAAYEH